MIETISLIIAPFHSTVKPRTPIHVRTRTTLDYRMGRFDACNKLSMVHNLFILLLAGNIYKKNTYDLPKLKYLISSYVGGSAPDNRLCFLATKIYTLNLQSSGLTCLNSLLYLP